MYIFNQLECPWLNEKCNLFSFINNSLFLYEIQFQIHLIALVVNQLKVNEKISKSAPVSLVPMALLKAEECCNPHSIVRLKV